MSDAKPYTQEEMMTHRAVDVLLASRVVATVSALDAARAENARLREALRDVLTHFECLECGEPATQYRTTEGDGPYWFCDSEDKSHSTEFYCAEEVTRPLDDARAALAGTEAP